MARFGRDIVRQLTDPTMAQGMFELGRQIGGLPGEKRKKKAEEQKKTALIDLENQLRQTATAGAEAARTGQVDAIELQIKSINEQLKTERDETKRQRLTDTYTLLSQNLSTARGVQEAVKGRAREVDIEKAIRGGDLSSADGNAVGITTARMRLAKLLETETDEKRRSNIFSAMNNLDKQLKGADQAKAQRNVDDLLLAEKLYGRLEAESESRANILANADPKSEEYLRARNESAAMVGIKQRMDELRADPDTARVVKEQKGAQRLAQLTQENQIQAAEETRAIAILSSLDPKSEEYKREKQRFKDNNLGEAVKKVEKAAQEVETAQLNLEKLRADVRPTPLTEEQKALGEKYGASFQEGTSREIILANRELLESTLSEVSKMGRELALRNMKPLDEPAARAKLNVMLTDLKEQGDLSFAKDFFMDDLEDDLRDLSEEDQQYLVDSMLDKTPEEAEQIVLEFVQRKFPESFERTQTEKTAEAEYEQDLRDAMAATFDKYPELDPNDPVDQAKVMEAANKQLRRAMGVPTAGEIFFGEVPKYDQAKGRGIKE